MAVRRSGNADQNISRNNKSSVKRSGSRRAVSPRSKKNNRSNTSRQDGGTSANTSVNSRARKQPARTAGRAVADRKPLKNSNTNTMRQRGRGNAGKSRRSMPANARPASNPSLIDRYKTIFNTPLKRVTSSVTLILIAALLLFGVFDTVMSIGRIHPGVSIAGVNIGGMTRAKAAETLDAELSPRLEQGAVVIYASKAAKENFEENSSSDTSSLNSASSYEGTSIMSVATNENDPLESSWATLPSVMGASIDGDVLAQKAYDVGRTGGRFLVRIKAWFGGIELAPELSMSDAAVHSALNVVNSKIGTPYTNADLSISQGKVSVTPSSHGNLVDDSDFRLALAQAMLSDERSFVATVKDTPPAVDDTQAKSVATNLEQEIASPVKLHYMYQSWALDATHLGDCLATRVDMNADGMGALVPYVDYDKTKQVFSSLLGGLTGSGATNAYFDVSSGVPIIVAGQTGLGPMLDKGADGLQTVLFGDTYRHEQREVTLLYGAVQPDKTTSDLEKMGIIENISTFSTHFNSSGSENRTYNIMLLANTVLNYCYIPPHSIWSFNETAGNCNEERGFKLSTAYVGGVHTQEAGGGICQVATTIFDTAYEAGLPIIERRSHSLYSENYRTIPDATVSYPELDLKFENNTDSWMLMTMSADEITTTVSLWGTSPGYTVTTEWSPWHEGETATSRVVYDSSYPTGYAEVVQGASNGWTVSITRHVTKNGVEVSTDTFYSYYGATDEVTVIGTG